MWNGLNIPIKPFIRYLCCVGTTVTTLTLVNYSLFAFISLTLVHLYCERFLKLFKDKYVPVTAVKYKGKNVWSSHMSIYRFRRFGTQLAYVSSPCVWAVSKREVICKLRKVLATSQYFSIISQRKIQMCDMCTVSIMYVSFWNRLNTSITTVGVETNLFR